MQFKDIVFFGGGRVWKTAPKEFTDDTSSLKVSFPKLNLDFFTKRLNSSNILNVEMTCNLKAIAKEQEFEAQREKY